MAKTSDATTQLPSGWRDEGGRLRAAYRFRDFQGAMSFLVEVAFQAEVSEHHPDFSVHWNEVRFEVWSHDVDRVTERDHKLVAQITKIAERHGAKTAK
jgi:4a-hydroxytetrahydrobiopterin dehydratase